MNDKFCEINQEIINTEFKLIFTRCVGDRGIEEGECSFRRKQERKEDKDGGRGEGGREEREKERKQRNEEGKNIQENSLLFSVPSLAGYHS